MKCKCGLEMELWQTTKVDGVVIKRYRCVCGTEKSEIEGKKIVEKTQPDDEYKSYKINKE